jgi:hypothetical protein
MYAARVDLSGNVLDPNAFALADGRIPECCPALVANDGVVLFAASILRQDAPFATYRLGTRVSFGGCPVPFTYCSALPDSSGSRANHDTHPGLSVDDSRHGIDPNQRFERGHP